MDFFIYIVYYLISLNVKTAQNIVNNLTNDLYVP